MSSVGDKFNRATTSIDVVDAFSDRIKGRSVVITGVTPGGIGFETARAIATKGPSLIIMVGRDSTKVEQAKIDILKEIPTAKLHSVIVDLTSLESVRRGAAQIAQAVPGGLDVLINNAAVMAIPYSKTVDGFERQFGTNFVGPFLLTKLLLPSLLKTAAPRVVFLSSFGHVYSDIRWDDLGYQDGKVYDKTQAYGQSKTAVNLTAVALADKYGKYGLVALSLHPGVIATNLANHLPPEEFNYYDLKKSDGTPLLEEKTIPAGAATTLTAAFDPRFSPDNNGLYLSSCQPAVLYTSEDLGMAGEENVRPYSLDKNAALRLWDLTSGLVGEKP